MEFFNQGLAKASLTLVYLNSVFMFFLQIDHLKKKREFLYFNPSRFIHLYFVFIHVKFLFIFFTYFCFWFGSFNIVEFGSNTESYQFLWCSF